MSLVRELEAILESDSLTDQAREFWTMLLAEVIGRRGLR